uniref:Secreted protein n=1 Tax=Nelumbo nucifera TaxID=4432 RepID=A0A822XWP8_NELNU|nr:TPA_asm: hypothetical protein HUJ06_025002 [Nelumbo nucifera]
MTSLFVLLQTSLLIDAHAILQYKLATSDRSLQQFSFKALENCTNTALLAIVNGKERTRSHVKHHLYIAM